MTLGPVPAGSVRAWVGTARRTIAVLRMDGRLGVPAEVVDAFERFVDEWAEIAEAGEEFRWDGAVDPAEVRRLAAYWALLANTARTDEHPAGLDPAPAQAQPFYDALVEAIATAVAADEADRFADKFEEVAPAFHAQRTPVRALGARRRVLLVDDTEDIRLLFRIALEADDRFEVCGEAGDGLEAVRLAASLRPDVIVLDVMMPVMDGLTALPQLRAQCPGAVVVVVTATATDDVRERAARGGAAAVVEKQASLAEITAAIAAV